LWIVFGNRGVVQNIFQTGSLIWVICDHPPDKVFNWGERCPPINFQNSTSFLSIIEWYSLSALLSSENGYYEQVRTNKFTAAANKSAFNPI
jgi:hypothetical protein